MAHGGQISMASADVVATAMKDWPWKRVPPITPTGSSPLTGATAEKHDSFITAPVAGKTLLQLTGKQLIMGEPDASSLPLRRSAGHLLRPGLHRLGHDLPRLCQGDGLRQHPLHPHHLRLPTPVRPWIPRPRCCAPWRPSASRPSALSGSFGNNDAQKVAASVGPRAGVLPGGPGEIPGSAVT